MRAKPVRGQRPCCAQSRRTWGRPRWGGHWCARCTRIWCVRPVLMVTSSSVAGGSPRWAHHLDQADGAPAVGVHHLVGRHHAHMAFAGGVQRLVQGQVDDLQAGRPVAKHQRGIGLAACRASGTGPAAPSARCASWPAAGCPRSPCPAGAPVPGTACGRAWRSCSITPKLTPLPPCTATPAGLAMASRCSSSSSTEIHAPGPAARRWARPGASAARGSHRLRPHGCRPGAALVDAHFAAADDAVDVRLGHALEQRIR
jgi:hypothetical protein